jgi:DNA ligase-1
MSEKLDGVRCYWDGANMFTRNGNKIYAPQEWKDKLPNIALDGELWSGRDAF